MTKESDKSTTGELTALGGSVSGFSTKNVNLRIDPDNHYLEWSGVQQTNNEELIFSFDVRHAEIEEGKTYKIGSDFRGAVEVNYTNDRGFVFRSYEGEIVFKKFSTRREIAIFNAVFKVRNDATGEVKEMRSDGEFYGFV